MALGCTYSFAKLYLLKQCFFVLSCIWTGRLGYQEPMTSGRSLEIDIGVFIVFWNMISQRPMPLDVRKLCRWRMV